jgi:uncharacterized SAM-binding protein YcdF (DUF218 family)
VVLGAAVWSGGRPSPTLARRADHAIALYHTGQIDAILGCGGLGKHPPTEAQVIGDLCRASGIPDSVLHTEDRSMTTRENLLNALPILDRLQPSRVVIVTDPYHAPRARLIARQIGLVASTDTPRAGSIGPRQWFRHAPREALAVLATVLRLR